MTLTALGGVLPSLRRPSRVPLLPCTLSWGPAGSLFGLVPNNGVAVIQLAKPALVTFLR